MQQLGSLRPRLTRHDGFSLSIQAAATHYCTPRNSIGPYSAVEIGSLSRPEPRLQQYAEDPAIPTSTVYGFVPAATLIQVVADHGGIAAGSLPQLIQ